MKRKGPEVTLAELIWERLQDGPVTAAGMAAAIGCTQSQASDGLVRLRRTGAVWIEGTNRRAVWHAVPGAAAPVRGRGSNPRSRANLLRRKSARSVPSLDWGNLLRGLHA